MHEKETKEMKNGNRRPTKQMLSIFFLYRPVAFGQLDWPRKPKSQKKKEKKHKANKHGFGEEEKN